MTIEASKLSISSSSEWLQYFQGNSNSDRNIDWQEAPVITNAERLAIAKSIQMFQLGESSEGKYLLNFVKAYAKAVDDSAYLECMRFFIREEQQHAQYLMRFMHCVGIPLVRRNWVDNVFRSLRRFSGLEISLSVLLVAETIAMTYYKALGSATQCQMLQSICNQILVDEGKHLEFQTQRLAIIRAKRCKTGAFLIDTMYKFLFFGTCLLVWLKLRRTYQTSGYTIGSFFTANYRWLKITLKAIHQNKSSPVQSKSLANQ